VRPPRRYGEDVILLNGRQSELQAGEPLWRALELLGVAERPRGVAVAVDGEVVPRERWREYRLKDGQRVEVLTAIQGG